MANFKFELGQIVRVKHLAGERRILARAEYLSGACEYQISGSKLSGYSNWYEEHDLIAVPETTQQGGGE